MRPYNRRLAAYLRTTLCSVAFVALGGLGCARSYAAEVVCLGASATQGDGVSQSEAFPAQLEAMLHAKGINVAVANAGRSGDTAAGMLARFDGVVDASTRVLVLGASSFNERWYGYKPEEVKASIADIIGKAHEHHIKVVNSVTDCITAETYRVYLCNGERNLRLFVKRARHFRASQAASRRSRPVPANTAFLKSGYSVGGTLSSDRRFGANICSGNLRQRSR